MLHARGRAERNLPSSGPLAWRGNCSIGHHMVTASPRAPCSVLFVDDDPLMRRSFVRAVRRRCQRWRVVTADCEASACRALESARFDAVVSDIIMPGKTGLSLLAEVRRSTPATRRVVYSGLVDRYSRNEELRSADLVLGKSTAASELVEALERLISQAARLAPPGDASACQSESPEPHLSGMPPVARDRPLIDAARDGDRGAIVKLLERYRDSVFRFGMRMCQSDADAEDVVQETLLTAAQKIDTFRGDASFSSWLYAIARSGCSRRRRTTRRETEVDPEAVVDSSVQPEEAVNQRRLGVILERALASLDSSYREVLLLRDVEGLTTPETAAALSLSEAAVKSRLHRARDMLRQRVEGLVRPEQSERPAPRCPDVVAVLSERLDQDLSAARCAELQNRLARCADPAGQFDALRELLGACRQCQSRQVPEKLKKSIHSAILAALEQKR